jgi:hypothetical protein
MRSTAADERDVNDPPYAIHNGMYTQFEGREMNITINQVMAIFPKEPWPRMQHTQTVMWSTTFIISSGTPEICLHCTSLKFCLRYMEERATHLGLLKNRPNERPFIISRSTFPSSGHWTGHWVCLASEFSLSCLIRACVAW